MCLLVNSFFFALFICFLVVCVCVFVFVYRHAQYPHQYRAMFVTNCKILRGEVLKYAPLARKDGGGGRRRRRRRGEGEGEREGKGKGKESEGGEVAGAESGGGGGGGEKDTQEGGRGGGKGETYHPVHCSVCDTDVAVYDRDEVFHFFNVLASAA